MSNNHNPLKRLSIIAEREVARANELTNKMIDATRDLYGIKEVHQIYDNPSLYIEQFLNKWIDRAYIGIAFASLILPMYELGKIIEEHESKMPPQKLEQKVNHQTP